MAPPIAEGISGRRGVRAGAGWGWWRSDRPGSDIPRCACLHPEGVALVDLCIHVANVFYLLSFLVRDMLWLRAQTCVGLMLGVVFFSCRKTPMYGPAAWHVAFLVINAGQIYRLVGERRQLRLTEEQERFSEATFQRLSREELLTLLTRVAAGGPEDLRDVHRACLQPLDPDEKVLRDLAFSRLTRKELLNLVTRRLWNSIKRRAPVRGMRPRRRGREAAPDRPEQGVASGSAAG